MQKPQTGTDRQAAIGELSPVLEAGTSDDHNYAVFLNSHCIVKYVNNGLHWSSGTWIIVSCVQLLRERNYGLKSSYCTCAFLT